MNSKTVLFVLCLLTAALLAEGDNEPRHDLGPSAGRRYKRMYVMCPPKFSRIGNECYYISPNKFNWLDAYFECKDHNSKLAEPMKYEDKHLRRYLQKIKHDLWIGGTYNWKSNKWQWGHNGRDIEYQSFSQMVPGSSRDLKFNCALLRSDLKFRWSAEECTTKKNFICQHRMPLVSEAGRYTLYDKWNKTYPYQQANEKLVYIMNEPINRNRSDSGKPRIYNSVKRVYQSNPSIQPRPGHRRPAYRAKKPAPPTRPSYYIPSDVVGRKQQVAQYAPDAANDLNTVDNGHRNGYTSVAHFNVDFSTRNGKNRDPSFPRGHRGGHGADRMEPRQPHQHRHQPSVHKTTKRIQHSMMPVHPLSPIRAPTTTTMSTTTTTTTTTPAPVPETTYQPATTRPPMFPPATTVDMKYTTTQEDKKAKRERLRERLRKLTPEEQQFFFQDRAKRKRVKEQLHQLHKLHQHRDNEVVQ